MGDFADDPRVVRLMTARPESPADGEDAADAKPGGASLPTLPEAFWRSRAYLEGIRAYARWRRVCPEAVLVQALCRAGPAGDPGGMAKLAPWEAPMRLSLFGVIVGPSGAGKSKAAAAARELVIGPEGQSDLPIGTGEGLASAFVTEVTAPAALGEKKGAKEYRQNKFAAHFHVDEGEALIELMKRQGAVLGESLRRGLVGETIGQFNASAERRRIVKNYVLGLTVNATAAVAARLISFSELGLPQRFIWASAIDPGRERYPAFAQSPILYPVRAGVLTFPDAVAEELDERAYRAGRGEIEIDDLDTHSPIVRGRVAAILAAWDCRDSVTLDDWELSGMIWDYSCAVRAVTFEEAETLEGEEQAREGQRRGRVLAATAAEVNGAPAKTERLAARLALWLHSTGKAASRRDVARRAKSSERHLVPAALEHAASAGWIRVAGERFAAGASRPA